MGIKRKKKRLLRVLKNVYIDIYIYVITSRLISCLELYISFLIQFFKVVEDLMQKFIENEVDKMIVRDAGFADALIPWSPS